MDGITVIKLEGNHYEDSCCIDPSVSSTASISVPKLVHPTDECEPLEIVTTIDNLVVKSRRKQSLQRRNIEESESSTPKNTLQTHSSSIRDQFNSSSTFKAHSCENSIVVSSAPKCEICSAAFNTTQALNLHLVRRHNYGSEKLNVKEFPCDMCSKVCYKKYELERHVVDTHVVDKPHECHVCSSTFIDQAALSKHLKSHDRQPCHVCDVCSKAYKSKKVLLRHLRVVHFRSFRCSKCKKSFFKKSEFHGHSRLQLQSQYSCQVCSKRCPSQCSHTRHIQRHIATEVENQDSNFKSEKIKNNNYYCEEFKCKLCLKTFDRETYLVAHRKLVHPDSQWPCSKCSQTFRFYYVMKEHELITHAPVRPYKCKLCHKSYCKRIYLTVHENKIHTNQRDFKCQLCLKSFDKLFGLKVHTLLVHRKTLHFKSQWPCSKCSRTFKSHYQVKLHELTHKKVGVKPFECKFCDKSYQGAKYLKVHEMAIHFKCQFCPGSFADNSSLKLHIAKGHSGRDRPFKCHICNAPWETMAQLKSHLRWSHRTRKVLFRCDGCSQTFKSSVALRSHERRCPFERVAKKQDMKTEERPESFAFRCHLCSFEAQHDREMAAHYYDHGLPKVTLQRISNFNK